MDSELIKQLLQGEIFWYETTASTATAATAPSAFVPYSGTDLVLETSVVSGCNDAGSSANLNKRVIGFLKKSWPAAVVDDKDVEKERGFRHMMNERMRRQMQKSSYFALHSMLPQGTKAALSSIRLVFIQHLVCFLSCQTDKQSIVQMAATRVQELEWLKNDLERRNHELQATLVADYKEENKIRVKIENPISGIDSMLEALKCFKDLESKPKTIHSVLSNQQFLAVMEFETQMGAAKAEKVVSRTLQETEKKLQQRWTNQIH